MKRNENKETKEKGKEPKRTEGCGTEVFPKEYQE